MALIKHIPPLVVPGFVPENRVGQPMLGCQFVKAMTYSALTVSILGLLGGAFRYHRLSHFRTTAHWPRVVIASGGAAALFGGCAALSYLSLILAYYNNRPAAVQSRNEADATLTKALGDGDFIQTFDCLMDAALPYDFAGLKAIRKVIDSVQEPEVKQITLAMMIAKGAPVTPEDLEYAVHKQDEAAFRTLLLAGKPADGAAYEASPVQGPWATRVFGEWKRDVDACAAQMALGNAANWSAVSHKAQFENFLGQTIAFVRSKQVPNRMMWFPPNLTTCSADEVEMYRRCPQLHCYQQRLFLLAGFKVDPEHTLFLPNVIVRGQLDLAYRLWKYAAAPLPAPAETPLYFHMTDQSIDEPAKEAIAKRFVAELVAAGYPLDQNDPSKAGTRDALEAAPARALRKRQDRWVDLFKPHLTQIPGTPHK